MLLPEPELHQNESLSFQLHTTFPYVPSFHIWLPSLLLLILGPSALLPVLLALLTGFSKWPSQAAGSLPRVFGDLPGRHVPFSTLSSSACPPLLLLRPSIHPAPLPPSAYFLTYLSSSLISISLLNSLSPQTLIICAALFFDMMRFEAKLRPYEAQL